MPELASALRVVARVRVIPGPVTLAGRAARGEFWCECHGWHRHDGDGGFTCDAEGSA